MITTENRTFTWLSLGPSGLHLVGPLGPSGLHLVGPLCSEDRVSRKLVERNTIFGCIRTASCYTPAYHLGNREMNTRKEMKRKD